MRPNPLISETPPLVLVFNPLKRLVGIYCSKSALARMFRTGTSNVSYACDGTHISYHEAYVRTLDPRIEITFEDLGVLKLEDYDAMCGEDRTYYLTKDMSQHARLTTTNKMLKKK